MDANLDIELDSKYMLNLVTRDLQKNEDAGYIDNANADLARITVERLQARRTKSRLVWVKSHSGQARNKGADRLAGEAANAALLPLNMSSCPSLQVSGAKLMVMTQAMAYKAIRKIKRKGTTSE